MECLGPYPGLSRCATISAAFPKRRPSRTPTLVPSLIARPPASGEYDECDGVREHRASRLAVRRKSSLDRLRSLSTLSRRRGRCPQTDISTANILVISAVRIGNPTGPRPGGLFPSTVQGGVPGRPPGFSGLSPPAHRSPVWNPNRLPRPSCGVSATWTTPSLPPLAKFDIERGGNSARPSTPFPSNVRQRQRRQRRCFVGRLPARKLRPAEITAFPHLDCPLPVVPFSNRFIPRLPTKNCPATCRSPLGERDGDQA